MLVGAAGDSARAVCLASVSWVWNRKRIASLALNRALVEKEPASKKNENIHGWTISRYRFFLTCALLMFFYFWIPNTLFKALRSFNWMTWIAPQNFTLAVWPRV